MLSRHARAVELEAVAEDGESEYLRGLCVNLRQRVAKIAVARVHQTPMVSRSLPNAILISAVCTLSIARGASAAQTADSPASDPYEKYVKTSKDFRPVKQDKAWCYKAFPVDLHALDVSVDHRLHRRLRPVVARARLQRRVHRPRRHELGDSKTGRLDWINKFKLRFYMDHTAGKGDLHLWDGGEMKPHADAVHGSGVRTSSPSTPPCAATLKGIIKQQHRRGEELAVSRRLRPGRRDLLGPLRPPVHVVRHRRQGRLPEWLKEIYGPDAAERRRLDHLQRHPAQARRPGRVGQFDASPLMDQWTFNDSYWNNFIGDLVEYANSVDPRHALRLRRRPVAQRLRRLRLRQDHAEGAVHRGLQPRLLAGDHPLVQPAQRHPGRHHPLPPLRGRHDLADLVLPGPRQPRLHRLGRGLVRRQDSRKPWHDEVAPDTTSKPADKIGPLLAGAEWMHDGVAIYYSHASIQLGWILDAEAHGKTWINRNGDDRLGASHQVRQAWENMLRDSGLQYNFISYADVDPERRARRNTRC